MNRPAYQMSWSLGPSPEAAERRMRAEREAERFDHARATEALWRDAQGPALPHMRAMLTRAFQLD